MEMKVETVIYVNCEFSDKNTRTSLYFDQVQESDSQLSLDRQKPPLENS